MLIALTGCSLEQFMASQAIYLYCSNLACKKLKSSSISWGQLIASESIWCTFIQPLLEASFYLT